MLKSRRTTNNNPLKVRENAKGASHGMVSARALANRFPRICSGLHVAFPIPQNRVKGSRTHQANKRLMSRGIGLYQVPCCTGKED